MDTLSIHNNLSVFVTLFAGEGQKIPQTLFRTRAPKTNGQSFVFHGLKPGAMVIFLLWRNGITPFNDSDKIDSFIKSMAVLPRNYYPPFTAVFSALSSLHKAVQTALSTPFFLKINFVFQSTFKYNKNEN
jgi:hypothetical protein